MKTAIGMKKAQGGNPGPASRNTQRRESKGEPTHG